MKLLDTVTLVLLIVSGAFFGQVAVTGMYNPNFIESILATIPADPKGKVIFLRILFGCIGASAIWQLTVLIRMQGNRN